MAKGTKSGRMGRPTKAPKPGERNHLGLRVTAELKQRLEEAAERAGRSLSAEAEWRLERSFLRDEWGGKVTEIGKRMDQMHAELVQLRREQERQERKQTDQLIAELVQVRREEAAKDQPSAAKLQKLDERIAFLKAFRAARMQLVGEWDDQTELSNQNEKKAPKK